MGDTSIKLTSQNQKIERGFAFRVMKSDGWEVGPTIKNWEALLGNSLATPNQESCNRLHHIGSFQLDYQADFDDGGYEPHLLIGDGIKYLIDVGQYHRSSWHDSILLQIVTPVSLMPMLTTNQCGWYISISLPLLEVGHSPSSSWLHCVGQLERIKVQNSNISRS